MRVDGYSAFILVPPRHHCIIENEIKEVVVVVVVVVVVLIGNKRSNTDVVRKETYKLYNQLR